MLIKQSEFAKRCKVTRQHINNLTKRLRCPFDIEMVGETAFIKDTAKTRKFEEQQRKKRL